MKYLWAFLAILLVPMAAELLQAQQPNRGNVRLPERRPISKDDFERNRRMRAAMPLASLAALEDVTLYQSTHPCLELENGQTISVRNGAFVFDKETRHTTRPIPIMKDSSVRAYHYGGYRNNNTYYAMDKRIQAIHSSVTRQNIRSFYADDVDWTKQEDLSYLRFELMFIVTEPLKVKNVVLFNRAPFPNPKIIGNTDGAILVSDDKIYAAIEHPMAKLTKLPDVAFEWKVTPDSTVRYFDVAGALRDKEISFRLLSDTPRVPAIASVALVYDDKIIPATALGDNEFKVKTPVIRKGDIQLAVTFAEGADAEGLIEFYGYNTKSLIDGRIPVNIEFEPGKPYVYSLVIGGIPEANQLRRTFANYLNNERAHPYRQFLFHTSSVMNEESIYADMRTFARELTGKRSTPVNSYLIGEGWDNPASLWGYNATLFPKHFDRLAVETGNQKSGLGAAFAPWGGDPGSAARTDFVKKDKLLDGERFDLADTTYGPKFSRRCLEMLHNYPSMNNFRFDQFGADNITGVTESESADMRAFLELTRALRRVRKDVFVTSNATWPSPFWLLYTDAVWRQDSAFGFRGDGNPREQWITFRDAAIYDRFVTASPFVPLNAIMSAPIIVDKRLPADATPEATRSFANDVWMLAGSGSSAQELAIETAQMTDTWWDAVSTPLRWARTQSNLLIDAHWIGGNPSEGRPYGYAAWRPGKGILVVRNPGRGPRKFIGTLKEWLELPESAMNGSVGRVKTVYSSQSNLKTPKIDSLTEPIEFRLPAWGVIVLEIDLKFAYYSKYEAIYGDSYEQSLKK